MKKFKDFLSEDGAIAGVLELVKLDVNKAYDYTKKLFESKNKNKIGRASCRERV